MSSGFELPCESAQFPFKRHCLGAVLAAALSLAYLQAVPAQAAEIAQGELHDYAIAAGPLGEVLGLFAGEAGITLSFGPELTEGKRSSGLSGRYSIDQAFAQLLAGQQLEALRGDGGVYLLRKQIAPPAGGVTVMQAVQVQADTERSSITEGSKSYTSGEISLGKGQSWIETPQTVTVITRQRIEDQALVSIADVIAQTPGITAMQGRGGEPEAFYSRGFSIDTVQIDGVSTGGGYDGNAFNPNLAMYDHVEVVRGADGLNAGTGEPGGSINLVRKRALAENQVQLLAKAGRWNDYYATADVTGALAFDGALRGRLSASYRDRDFFYDKADDLNRFAYGTIEADLTSSTLLTVGGSYEKRNRTANYSGLPRYTDGSSMHLPRSTSLIPNWNDGDFKTRELFTRVEHRFNENWSVQTSYTDIDREGWELLGGVTGYVNPETGAGASGYAWDYGYLTRRKAFDMHLNGAFELLNRQHELLVGVDQFKSGGTQYYNRVSFDVSLPTNIDVFDFDPSVFPDPTGSYTMYNYGPSSEKRSSAYTKLLIQLLDPLKLAVGARYGRYEYQDDYEVYKADGSFWYGGSTRYEDRDIFTPYAGLLYRFAPQWMSYASMAQIDKSQASTRIGPPPGTPADPIHGRNYEVGIKGELADGALRVAFALYRIERTGEVVQDPDNPPVDGAACCYIGNGRITSQGVDTEIAGELLRGWQVSAGYTYNENKNDRENNAVYSSITPRHMLRFWNTWQLSGVLAPVKLGLGATMQSDAYEAGTRSSIAYRTEQGGYALWNGMAEYRFSPAWSLALNVSNAFDKVYNAGIGQRDGRDWYGEPRNVFVSVRGKL